MSAVERLQWSDPVLSLSEFRDQARRIEQPFRHFPRPDGQLFAVLGGAGMGKSSMLNVLPEWLMQKPARSSLRLVPCLIQYDPGDLISPGAFLLRLLVGLRAKRKQLEQGR